MADTVKSEKMQQVVSYIMSLEGTNPPNGKTPEGNVYSGTDSTAAGKDSLKSNSGNGKEIKSDTAVVKK